MRGLERRRPPHDDGRSGRPDLLETIVAATRACVDGAPARQSPTDVAARPRQPSPAGRRRFARALRDVAGAARHRRVQAAVAVARHPAAGLRRRRRTPQAYAAAGAAAISVLTEPTFFDGALAHLAAVRARRRRAAAAQGLHRRRVPARSKRSAAGADAVLLIVGALDDRSSPGCSADARSLGLAALVEVHDAGELARAVDAGARDHRRQQPQPADADGRPRRAGRRSHRASRRR